MKKLPSLLVALSLTSAGLLSAQTTAPAGERGEHGERGGRRGPGGPGRGGHPIVRTLDADKNREISAAEIANATVAIRALDTSGDGLVSADELRPKRPAGAPDRPDRKRPADATRGDSPRTRPADPVMLALDANSDGSLGPSEIANATASLTALDTNKDGKLTLDELRPLPPTQ